jgi:hypothetical protein
MTMPMVQVGPVVMNVLLRVMFVSAHMAHLSPKSVMGVIVMAPIVPMTMLM